MVENGNRLIVGKDSANRNPSIDLFKFICALMVIGIHTNVMGVFSDSIICFFGVIFSLAVPYFALCSGFFLSRSIEKIGFSSIKKQFKKMLRLYVVWTAIYLAFTIPGWINDGWFSVWAFVDFGISIFRTGSHYHLWYLLSMLYALPLFYLIVKFVKNRKVILLIALFLYGVKAFSYGYRSIFPLPFRQFYHFTDVHSALFQAMCFILPLLLLGSYLATQKCDKRKRFLVFAFIISLAILCCEAFMLRAKDINLVSFLFFTAPTACLFFLVIMHFSLPLPQFVCSILGSSSLYIYCIHPIFVELFLPYVNSPVLLFFLVVLVSVVISTSIVIIRSYHH